MPFSLILFVSFFFCFLPPLSSSSFSCLLLFNQHSVLVCVCRLSSTPIISLSRFHSIQPKVFFFSFGSSSSSSMRHDTCFLDPFGQTAESAGEHGKRMLLRERRKKDAAAIGSRVSAARLLLLRNLAPGRSLLRLTGGIRSPTRGTRWSKRERGEPSQIQNTYHHLNCIKFEHKSG